LAPGAGLGGGLLGRPREQREVVRGPERVWRHDRVRVVAGPVLACEGDPTRPLPQPVLQVRADLTRPFLEPLGRTLDQLSDLRHLLRLLLAHREPEVERELAVVRRHVRELPAHPLLVRGQPAYGRVREADQVPVAVVQVDERALVPVCEILAAWTGAVLVVGANMML